MSKPETPCHPDCYVGAGGSILHAPGCTKNAPKAEAPRIVPGDEHVPPGDRTWRTLICRCGHTADTHASVPPLTPSRCGECMCADWNPKAEAPPTPKRCGVCGNALVQHRVYMRPDSWVCVKSGCPAWRWDGEPAPPAPPAPKCNHAKIDPSQPCDVCPPAPVSEPPIDWKRVLKFANEYEDDWTPGDLPNASRAILSLIAENAALKAQNAALEAESARRLSLVQQYEVELSKAKRDNAPLTAELARLRAAADRVVKHRNKHYRDVRETVDALESVLARSLRAAREAGKA